MKNIDLNDLEKDKYFGFRAVIANEYTGKVEKVLYEIPSPEHYEGRQIYEKKSISGEIKYYVED